MFEDKESIDITEINLETIFLHYMNVKNINNIFEKGLEPKIGENSKGTEKIKLLKYQEEYTADKILKYLIDRNMEFVKLNCELLYQYYKYFYISKRN